MAIGKNVRASIRLSSELDKKGGECVLGTLFRGILKVKIKERDRGQPRLAHSFNVFNNRGADRKSQLYYMRDREPKWYVRNNALSRASC